MSYGGLRGAVAFALALLIKEKRVESQPMFVTTTIAVIYFTVFVQGITIKPLVRILNVKRASKRKPTMNERIHERVSLKPNTFVSKKQDKFHKNFLFAWNSAYRPYDGWHGRHCWKNGQL